MTAPAPALELDLVGRAVERLRGRIPAADVPTIEDGLQLGDTLPEKIPAVLVVLVADDAGENAAPAAGTFQRITATLAVVHVLAARNTRRNAGGQAVSPLKLLLGRTRGMLNGWRVPVGEDEDGRPVYNNRRDRLALRRGRLLDVADGRAVWQDEYITSWRAQSVQDTEEGA